MKGVEFENLTAGEQIYDNDLMEYCVYAGLGENAGMKVTHCFGEITNTYPQEDALERFETAN